MKTKSKWEWRRKWSNSSSSSKRNTKKYALRKERLCEERRTDRSIWGKHRRRTRKNSQLQYQAKKRDKLKDEEKWRSRKRGKDPGEYCCCDCSLCISTVSSFWSRSERERGMRDTEQDKQTGERNLRRKLYSTWDSFGSRRKTTKISPESKSWHRKLYTKGIWHVWLKIESLLCLPESKDSSTTSIQPDKHRKKWGEPLSMKTSRSFSPFLLLSLKTYCNSSLSLSCSSLIVKIICCSFLLLQEELREVLILFLGPFVLGVVFYSIWGRKKKEDEALHVLQVLLPKIKDHVKRERTRAKKGRDKTAAERKCLGVKHLIKKQGI